MAGSDRSPLTVGGAPAKRMPSDDCERAAVPVGCKPSHRLAGNLLPARFAGYNEQPIAPRRHKYGWTGHRNTFRRASSHVVMPSP